MFIGIYDEIGADIATIIIFAIFLYYIVKEIKQSEMFTATIFIATGIITIGISDIISLLGFGSIVDCLAGKIMAVGSLIAALGILHAITVYPQKNIVHKALPSLYTLSVVLVIYLFASPHFIYCDPVTGGEHGAFWDIFVIWVYSIFFASAGILLIRLFTAKVRIVRLRYFYMSVGVVITLVYLSVAQVVPIYVENINYFTAVHVLPFMGAMFLIAMLKYGMFVLTPSRESGHTNDHVVFKDGEVVGISSVHHAYILFRELLTSEPGMIITVRPPQLLAERYLLRRTPIVWLTYFHKKYSLATIPDRLHFEVMDSTIQFVHNGGRAVLIDGAEYLTANFGRRFLMEFVEDLRQAGKNVKIILAVNDKNIVEGFADEIIIHDIPPPEPRVMTIKNSSEISVEDTLIITTHDRKYREDWEKATLLRVAGDFNADRMIFEGMKKVEDSLSKNVYIECMDYLLSVAPEKKVMNLLKDIIDVTIVKGGKVYIRYTPRLEESSLISQFIEFIG